MTSKDTTGSKEHKLPCNKSISGKEGRDRSSYTASGAEHVKDTT